MLATLVSCTCTSCWIYLLHDIHLRFPDTQHNGNEVVVHMEKSLTEIDKSCRLSARPPQVAKVQNTGSLLDVIWNNVTGWVDAS